LLEYCTIYRNYRCFQPLVKQIVAEFLQRLEWPQRQQSLGTRNFVEGELHRTAAVVDEMQEGGGNSGGLLRGDCAGVVSSIALS
jgi:hypothetical protein